jgi:hypothetical protein
MAKCAYCGTTLLFGGKKEGNLRFCNDTCRQKGHVLLVASQVPDDVVKQHARDVYAGPCPKCKQRRGPVDVHTAHKVWSAIFMTSWSSAPQVSCRSCGVKAMLFGTTTSLLFGWWGIPWGILITPVQVAKNVWGLLRTEETKQPSRKLEQMVRMNLASHALARANQIDA